MGYLFVSLMESLTACGKKRNCFRLGSKRIAPSVEHAVDLVVNLSAGFAALISIHWTTARVSASFSSDWPAAVRPTLPPPRRAVCFAMVWAPLGGQPGNNLKISRFI